MMAIMAITGTAQNNSLQKDQKEFFNSAVQTLDEFKKTSPFALDENRLSLLYDIEVFSDSLSNTTFKEYFKSSEQTSAKMEQTIPMLYFYRYGFEKVLDEVKNTEVEKGTAVVWMLYNMGVVVKTPTGCFGMDIDHKYAVQLEPYLDFLCASHKHGDHFNAELMKAMTEKGKPVLSNFYEEDGDYLSTEPASYEIGEFTIHTSLTDHLTNIDDFNTVFRVECGEDSGGFSILHCGDSGFKPERYVNVQGPVSMVVLRWGAPRENNILGTGSGQVNPKYAVLSHLIELRHNPYPRGQASIAQTLKHLPNVECENTVMPFWGEKMIWKDNVMY